MLTVALDRLETGPQGTFGRWTSGALSLFTGELPWHDNAANVSCLPDGDYVGRRTWSPHLKRSAYVLLPTAPRAGLRIHSANLMGDAPPNQKQLNGCIGLGEKLGWIDGQKALLLSRPAVRRFETMMGGKDFRLEIRWGCKP